jgi:hypothetical protein
VHQVCDLSPPLRRLHQQLLTTDAALDLPVIAGPTPYRSPPPWPCGAVADTV